MTFTADFLSYLVQNPMFNIIIQYLVTILEDVRFFPTMLPDYMGVDYWTLGCGQYAAETCTFIQP